MSSEHFISPFLFEDKWGYRDNEGNVLVEPLWDYADDFYEGLAIVRNDKELYGFIDSYGQIAIECQYEDAMKYINGVALVKTKDGNWEHINCKGELLHNCPWIDVFPYSEGVAAVRIPISETDDICGVSARYGFINEERELVIPCDYSQVSSFQDGFAKVSTLFGDSGFINKEGKFMFFIDIVEPYEDSEKEIPLPKEWVKKNDLSTTYDLYGIPQEIHSLYFKEGLAIVIGNNHKYGFINSEGELAIPCKWPLVYNFHDGLAFVSDKKQNESLNWTPKGGLINLQGEYIIPSKWVFGFKFYQWFNTPTPISDQEIAFTEGLIAVKGENNRWGFIDKKGKIQIPLRWIEVRCFHEGYAAVRGLNGRYGFVDYRGNLICKLMWAKVADFHEGMACVFDDNLEKYGYLNCRGDLQIPCKFNSGDDFHEGIANVKLNGKDIQIDDFGVRIEAEHDNPIDMDGETSSYERYRGSYAQDEMGYSDDDIDTIFDGDPDAYWNID